MKPKVLTNDDRFTEALLSALFKKEPESGRKLFFISDRYQSGIPSEFPALDHALDISANEKNIVIFFSASEAELVMYKHEEDFKELILRKNVRFLRIPFRGEEVVDIYRELLEVS